MTPEEENKLMKVLEYYLSLHEADEVWNAIFDSNVTAEQVEMMLDNYRKQSEER